MRSTHHRYRQATSWVPFQHVGASVEEVVLEAIGRFGLNYVHALAPLIHLKGKTMHSENRKTHLFNVPKYRKCLERRIVITILCKF